MLTQYNGSEDDQGMTRLLNFIRILGGMRRRIRKGRVRLTQYLESPEDQDITRLTLLRYNLRGGGGGLCFYVPWN